MEQLENVPFKWEDTKKVTLNAREMLGPLQSMQQEKVKEETEDFRHAHPPRANHPNPSPSPSPNPNPNPSPSHSPNPSPDPGH
jgi:hypothetical protein